MADREMTLDDLRRVLREVAGETDVADLDGDIADASFQDLGYDSLAILELSARIEQEYGVHLTDEEVGGASTPDEILQIVNGLAGAA